MQNLICKQKAQLWKPSPIIILQVVVSVRSALLGLGDNLSEQLWVEGHWLCCVRKCRPAERKCTGAEGGQASFTTGRFISCYWSEESRAADSQGLHWVSTQKEVFKMDSEGQNVPMSDYLILWLSRNMGAKGKKTSFYSHLHHSSTSCRETQRVL